MSWARHVARIGDKRNSYRIFMGKPEGKRPLGRPRRSWEDNIRIDLREIWWGGMDWIDLAQDRDQWRALVNTFGIYNMLGNSWVAAQLATSQEELSSMELVRNVSVYVDPLHFIILPNFYLYLPYFLTERNRNVFRNIYSNFSGKKALLTAFLVYYSTLKMEAVRSSETSVNFYQHTLFHTQKTTLFIFTTVTTSYTTHIN
jgi:hypothetical protein